MLHTFLFLAFILIEVFVLIYIERISWGTLYTPLTCLMLPYLLVLLCTMAISGHFHFVEFSYPSSFRWNIGLFLFAIPSYILSLATKKYPIYFSQRIKEERYPIFLGILSILISLLFIVRFYMTIKSSIYMFGTDDFAEDFAGHGIWAHLRDMVMPLLIIAIYFVSKKNWWLWGIILALLTIQVLYMVKGAIIISAVSGICIRLYAHKMRLNISLVLKALFGAFALFLMVYMVLPLMGKENGQEQANMQLVEFVTEHFLHYFTSGTLGLSYDLQLNCPDKGDFEILFSQFVNIYKFIVGDKTLLSPVNPIYLNTGITLTNVRTFFGTMYIYCNSFQFVCYTLIFSFIMYSVKLIAHHSESVFVYAILCYYCGLLAMGWFEFYFFHLAVLEVPIITMILFLITKIKIKNKAE